MGKGWFPVFVELRNIAGERRDVTLEFTAGDDSALAKRAGRRVLLEPGERRTIEVLLPDVQGPGHAYAQPSNYDLKTRIGSSAVLQRIGPDAWTEDHHTLIVFRAEGDDAVERVAFEAEVVKFAPTALLDPTSSLPPSAARRDFLLSASAAPFERLSKDWAAYSSVHVVGIDLSGERPPAARLEPLAQWVRLGGALVVRGDGPRSLEQVPSLEGAFESRFRVAGSDGIEVYRHGLGRIYLVSAPDFFGSAAVRRAVKDALLETDDRHGAQRGFVPTPGEWRLQDWDVRIPGVGELPLRTFMALLFLFAILIGPVNLLVLKKLGKPALLLITIPVISGAASLGLLVYGVLYQGIDTKATRRAISLLDQRTARVATVERSAVFVGLSQGRGLRPGAGTAVFPAHVTGNGERYDVHLDDGMVLAGSYLPPRDPVANMILHEGAARTRLEVSRRDGVLEVTNAFEVGIEELVLRDPGGAWFHHRGRLEPGESARLKPSRERSRLATELEYDISLLPASYSLRLVAPAFDDTCGLKMSLKQHGQVLMGILPIDEEYWR